MNSTLETAVDTLTDEMKRSAVKEKLQAAATATKDAGVAVASEIKTRAAETLEAARDAAVDRVGAAKEAVSDAGSRLAETLRDAAANTEAEGFPARALNLVAGGISDAARALNGQSLSTIVADTRAFARRNPAVFALGAAVAAFALIRVVRASGAAAVVADGNVRPQLRNQPGRSS